MPLISSQRKTFTINLSPDGRKRLDRLTHSLGYRRSGTVLTAVRICARAHVCRAGEPIFYQADNGAYRQLRLRRCRPFEIDEAAASPLLMSFTVQELALLKGCRRLAGNMLIGAETSLWVLERLTSREAPSLYERRGSVYYPLLHDCAS